MTLAISIVVAALGGLVALAAPAMGPGAGRAGRILALVAALACAALAVVTPVGDLLSVGGLRLSATPAVRLAELGWSGALVGLGLIAAALRIRPVTAPGLVALAAGLAALAADLPAVAFGGLAVGGAAAVLVPSMPRYGESRRRPTGAAAPAGVVAPATLAVLGSGLLALVLVAWARSPVGAAASGAVVAIQDVAFQSAVGLAVLAMAALVAVRLAAIPAHLWAARLVGAVSSIAIPSALAWGSAAFSIVAITWSEATLGSAGAAIDPLDHWLVILVGVGGLALGALASILHDDLEHVLGYWLIGAAGVTLLAFAAPTAAVVPWVADWTFGIAAIATGFAAWIVVVRWSFGTHRVGSLPGWARRSPGLAIGLVVLLVGSVALPGTSLWSSRASIAAAALPGAPGTIVTAGAALASLVVFGRLLLVGLARPAGDVAAAPPERIGRLVLAPRGWTGGGTGWLVRRGKAMVVANLALGLDLVVVGLCVLGLLISALGMASAGA